GDVASMTACMVFLSIPGFVLGYLLIFLFAVTWRIFPVIGGEKTLSVAALWRHLTLPALSLGLGYAGTVARMTRSTMVEVLNSDYIRTARSKGLRQSTIVFRHAMRNTLTSLVSMIGVQVIVMLGGLVVTETVFSRPGLGRLYFTAVSARDYPLMQGSILVIAVCVVVVTFLVDLSYGIIDPRIQYT
ncbi:MAG: ABC transporter permease, partial [Candidatus Bipolaricaulis sp.]|nr:ABC transporter permease [Candidatus Bipolaricaulis sp.]